MRDDFILASPRTPIGAITSKPAAEAARELAPERQGRGLTYRSPIVRMRQVLDLYGQTPAVLHAPGAGRGNPR